MKWNSVFVWMLLSMILVLGGCSHTSYLESSDTIEDEAGSSEEAEADDEPQAVSQSIFVQVAGAVKQPGVYELAQGARVFEAIESAGGLRKDADDISLNQASVVSDGEKIYVYHIGELEAQDEAGMAEPEGTASGGTASGSGLVNINTADVNGLKTLSGIGDAKAQAIISYREANGGFHSVEELTQVDGIGEATLQKLRDAITI